MLAIKGNQKLFYEEVKMFMNDEKMTDIKKKGICCNKTVEKEQGGISTREYYITDETEWFSEKGKWKQLNTFGKVRRTLEKKNGEITVEDRYYICSIGADVLLFSRAVRGHWVMDYVFHDDKNTTMEKQVLKICR